MTPHGYVWRYKWWSSTCPPRETMTTGQKIQEIINLLLRDAYRRDREQGQKARKEKPK